VRIIDVCETMRREVGDWRPWRVAVRIEDALTDAVGAVESFTQTECTACSLYTAPRLLLTARLLVITINDELSFSNQAGRHGRPSLARSADGHASTSPNVLLAGQWPALHAGWFAARVIAFAGLLPP